MTKPIPRPISLNGLRFSDDRGKFVVSEDHFLTFRNRETLERFINNRHAFWQDLLNMKLQFMQDASETLAEIEVYKVLRLVAKSLGIPIETALSESTKDAVEARRLAIKICVERKVRIGSIAKGLGMAHDLVIYHKNRFNDYYKTNKSYRDKYIEVENFVFSTMYGRFVEDGSGNKKEEENDKSR